MSSDRFKVLAVDGWSCKKVAGHLNALGVPTVYAKDGRPVRRGLRTERTSGRWDHSRIRKLVLNPIYRGELQYGKKNKSADGIISASIPALVSDEIWHAANETIKRGRIIPRNTDRHYLLRSIIVCGNCGAHYSGGMQNGAVFYRCNGCGCIGKWVQGPHLEPPVWADIERFLRDPGDLLEELQTDTGTDTAAVRRHEERAGLEAAVRDLQQRRQAAIDLRTRGKITDEDLDRTLEQITAERASVEAQLAGLAVPEHDPRDNALSPDLLDEIRRRLDEGRDDAQRQEIVQSLVRRITINTEVFEHGKQASAIVEYRFPADTAVPTHTACPGPR